MGLKYSNSNFKKIKKLAKQTCGRTFGVFATKGPKRGETFFLKVFHPLCPTVDLRLSDWHTKEICKFAIAE
jgi:hypothetical protein